MRNSASVVIIGGGINGVSVAYHLAKLGAKDIIVLEKDYLAAGSTGRCGAGVREQWGTEMNCRLAQASIKKFERMNDELEYDDDIEFKQKGYLILAHTEKEHEQFKKNLVLQHSLGIPSRLVTPSEAKQIVPHLNTEGLLAATFCPEDGHINPFKAVDAYAKAARRLGVDIETGVEVTGIRVAGGRIVAVETNRGAISTGTVVNCAGPYSQLIGAMAGVKLPVYSERHQILVTEPVDRLQDPMVMSFSRAFYVQQSPHGSFIMGFGDPNEPHDAYETGHTWEFLETVAKVITWHLPVISKLRVVRQWSGMYNLTPDRQPILGPVDDVAGYYQAIGFSGHGFMLGPVIGELLAQRILGLPLTMPIDQLHLNRFARGELILEPSVV
ncbi:MAG: NAD(P)/FAD-dependent oxidoreductase [Chloroflexota bacterium]